MKLDVKRFSATLNKHLPLFWVYDGNRFLLKAVTAQFKSGKQRVKTLASTDSPETAAKVSIELLRSWPGQLDISALLERVAGAEAEELRLAQRNTTRPTTN